MKTTLLAICTVLALTACGAYSTQEAYVACDQERAARGPTAFTDESFASCVACFETCGIDCEPKQGEQTLTYACPP